MQNSGFSPPNSMPRIRNGLESVDALRVISNMSCCYGRASSRDDSCR